MIMASIRKRTWTTAKGETKTAWCIDFVDQIGKRQRKQFATKRAADSFRITVEGEIHSGTYRADARKMTVKELVDAWLIHCQSRVGIDLEWSTSEDYKVKARYILDTQHGLCRMRLIDVTAGAIDDFRISLASAGLSKRNARTVVRGLSAAFTFGQERSWVASNPVLRSRRRNGDSRDEEQVAIPDHEDVKRLIAEAYKLDQDFGLFLKFAALTGLRSSEQRGLLWRHVDLKANRLTVETRVDRRNERGSPKSKAGRRKVPLPPNLVAELRAHKLKVGGSEDTPVFPARNGQPLRHENVLRRAFYPARKEAGASDINWHALRHYAISCWIAAGLTAKTVQVRAGHSSIRMTFDRYGHLFPDGHEGAEMAAIESRLADGT
jgi:integrase